MATAKDGSLTFDTKFSTAEFEKGVKSIETLLGKVAVNLVGKMGQAGRETEKTVSTAAAGAAKEAGKSVASASSLITGFLKNDLITAGVSFMLDFVDQGIGMASQMQMVQQQVNATFGKEAGTLNGWAQDASNSYGLSEQAAKGYANEVGKTLKKAAKSDKDVAKMSKGIVGLSVDMASFYQLDHKEVLTALEKAVSGDAAALDKMGISMGDTELQAFALSEGITKSYGEMSEAEKVALRYDYVMAQTAQAQGAFAESSGTHSSQMQIFQANVQNLATGLGNVLLPAVNWALTGLNSLFAGPPRNELTSQIETATTALDTVKSDVSDIKNNFANEVIAIKIKYESDFDLLDEYEQLASKENITQSDVTRMQEIIQTLKDNYKEMADYVGDDGLLNTEIETVRNLIGGYEELDKKRAYSSMVSALENEAQVAEIQKDIAYEAYFTAKQRVEQYDELKDHLGGISDKAGMREYTENIETGLPLLQDYIRVMSEVDGANPFANLDTSNLTDLETFLNNFGGWDALLKLDPSAIQDGTGAAADLLSLIGQLFRASTDAGITIDNMYAADQTNFESANQALLKAYDVVNKTGREADAARQSFEKLYNMSPEEYISSMNDAGDASDNAAAKANDAGKALEEGANVQGAVLGNMNENNAVAEDELNKTDQFVSNQGAKIGELEAQALTVEQLAANIQVAQEAGATAQADLAARKETVVADAQAILTSMNDLIAALALDVDTMVTTMNTIVTNGEVGAATAGNAFAQGAGDGYRANTALRDAVGASAQQSLAALNSYANAFETAGSGLVGSIASGVTGNASVLSDAVRDAVRGALAAAQSAFSGNSVFRTASRYYPHRTGLEYVPYDEYPALLHKGESVLTASEAALWRGGLYVREPGAARVDYDALAAAIWRGAPPEGGLAISVNLDGEEVANVLEPSISALQGRRLALQRR